MKKVIIISSVLILIMLIVGTIYVYQKDSLPNPKDTTNNTNEGDEQTSKAPIISICCDIARKKYDCLTGGGLCNCRIRIGGCGGAKSRALDVKIVGKNLFIESNETFPADAGLFVFDGPTALADDIAKSLGYHQVIIQPGTYTVNQSENKQKVKLNITTH